jgi:hypothetical protein
METALNPSSLRMGVVRTEGLFLIRYPFPTASSHEHCGGALAVHDNDLVGLSCHPVDLHKATTPCRRSKPQSSCDPGASAKLMVIGSELR